MIIHNPIQSRQPIFRRRAWRKGRTARIALKLLIAGLISGGTGGLGLAQTASAQSGNTAAGSTQPPGLTGLWLDHTRRGAVEIKPCGRSLCGRIVWMKVPRYKNGKLRTDRRNSDRSKRGRPICGLQIIGGVRKRSRRIYENGRIYSPERGRSFDVELTLVSANILKVVGYAGSKFFSRTHLWKRVRKDLKRCAN